MPEDRLPTYPIEFIHPVVLRDGTLLQLRPIHPKDGAQAADFKSRVSPESIYNRFLGYLPPLSKEVIERFTEVDYEREIAMVAESIEDEKEPVAVARLASLEGSRAELAIIIADAWQRKGLGTLLIQYMVKVAIKMKFDTIYASYFAENKAIEKLMQRNGFQKRSEEGGIVKAELPLDMEGVDFAVDIEF
ncbi:MAG: GNAT family protein [Bacteroidota bacterium]